MIEIEDNQEKEWESSFFDDSEDGENPKTVRGPNAPKDLWEVGITRSYPMEWESTPFHDKTSQQN